MFIRHGKTPGNEEKRYIGRTDEDLSAQGILELQKKEFSVPELLFSSPMIRCLSTAKILFPGITALQVKELREIDFGDFEGKNYQELTGNADYQAWIDSGGSLPFPNGESREQFVERSLSGMQAILARTEQYLKENGRERIETAAVVHGGTIMAILSELYGGDYYDYQIPNGQGYLVKLKSQETGEGWRITSAERVEV